MSTLKTTNLQNADASGANIVLGQGSGGGATISGVTTTSGGIIAKGQVAISAASGALPSHWDSSTRLSVNGRINSVGSASTASLNTGNGTVVNVGALTDHNVQIMSGNDSKVTVENSTSDVKINDGDLYFGTAGKGICLGVTANTDSNTLDDYEEGLYTGTLTCISSGTVTVDSTKDQLAYTKIGRVVYVNGRIKVSAVSSPSGAQLRLNLPFTSTAGTEDSGRVCGWIQVQLASEHIQDYDSMPTAGGNSYIQIGFSDTTNSVTDICSSIIVGTYIACNFFYTVV